MRKTNFIQTPLEIPKKEISETFFNKIGESTKTLSEKVFAKVIVDDDSTRYYILTHMNVPYDPLGPNCKRERLLQLELKRVSKDTFDFYIIYLKTNNSLYLTKANRSFLQGVA